MNMEYFLGFATFTGCFPGRQGDLNPKAAADNAAEL